MTDILYKINRNYYQNKSVVKAIKKEHPNWKVYKAKNIIWEEVDL